MTTSPTTIPFSSARCSSSVLWLRGEHDAATAAQVRSAADRLASATASDVLVDLSDVGFMDASIVGVFVDIHVALEAQGRSLVLRAPSRTARRVLELCGLQPLIRPATVVAGETPVSLATGAVRTRTAHGLGQAFITGMTAGALRTWDPIAS